MDKYEIIFNLFRIIDDIDTGMDMFKDDYKGFQKYVMIQIKRRWECIDKEFIDELYDKYYKEDAE